MFVHTPSVKDELFGWMVASDAIAYMPHALHAMMNAQDHAKINDATNVQSFVSLMEDLESLVHRHVCITPQDGEPVMIWTPSQGNISSYTNMSEALHILESFLDRLMDVYCGEDRAMIMTAPVKDLSHPEADIIDFIRELEYITVSLRAHWEELNP